MDQIKELRETFLEEYKSAKILEERKLLKSSVILLSKALFAICDYILFKKYNKLPKNHAERFRILENKEPQIYFAVNKVWSKYTDTYSKPSEKESFIILNETILELVQNEGIDKEIKTIVKK